MSTRLPKGKQSDLGDMYSASMWGYSDDYGTNENEDPEYKTTDLTKKCTCGVTITMGKEDDPMFHSEYCNLYQKKETK